MADARLENLRLNYLTAVLSGDRAAVAAAMQEGRQSGLLPEDLLLRIIAAAQREVGERWHRGEIGIAEEHWATEVAREEMAKLRQAFSPQLRQGQRLNGKAAMVAVLPGEVHDLPGRMVADLLLWQGWMVDYLGGKLPVSDLVLYISRRQPDLVVVSATLQESLPAVADLGGRLMDLPSRPRYLVGGAAFGSPARLPSGCEVDAIATDALHGVRLAAELVGLGGPPDLDAYLETVGARIRRLRGEARLSQSELSELAGLTRPYLSAVEKGSRNITLEVALKLAGALGVPVSELLSES